MARSISIDNAKEFWEDTLDTMGSEPASAVVDRLRVGMLFHDSVSLERAARHVDRRQKRESAAQRVRQNGGTW